MPLIRRARLRAGSQVLVTLLVALTGVVLTQLPAHACVCAQQTFQEQVENADVVFTGAVASVSGTGYAVTADRVYKGELAAPEVTVDSPAGDCSLGQLPSDRPYVFLVEASGATYSANSCSGTAPVSVKMEERLTRVLGAGQPPATPLPDSATYTTVEESAPTSLARLAAPGAALVILGLLGLVVVRRLGRR